MEASQALNRLAAWCARGERCESDVRRKLMQWEVSAEQARQIVARLRREGYLDDCRYARAFCHDKHAYSHWGRVKIASHLRAKGLPREVIDEALEHIADEGYDTALLAALRRKASSCVGKPPHLRRAALLRLAASRGFEPDVAFRLVEQVMDEDENSNDE